VDVGIKAFMPGSQADPRPVHNLDSLTGQDIPVKIIKLKPPSRQRGGVAQDGGGGRDQRPPKNATLDQISEGAIVTGVVKNLTEYGAFIDLGGIDGLLHVTDMSYGRITHPSEMLHVDEEITVQGPQVRSRQRAGVAGHQTTRARPVGGGGSALPRQQPGDRRVVNVHRLRRFRELEPGIEGLIHISEMTWSRRMKHPSKVVNAGRSGGSGGAGGALQGPAHFAGPEAARTQTRGRTNRHPLIAWARWWRAGYAT